MDRDHPVERWARRGAGPHRSVARQDHRDGVPDVLVVRRVHRGAAPRRPDARIHGGAVRRPVVRRGRRGAVLPAVERVHRQVALRGRDAARRQAAAWVRPDARTCLDAVPRRRAPRIRRVGVRRRPAVRPHPGTVPRRRVERRNRRGCAGRPGCRRVGNGRHHRDRRRDRPARGGRVAGPGPPRPDAAGRRHRADGRRDAAAGDPRRGRPGAADAGRLRSRGDRATADAGSGRTRGPAAAGAGRRRHPARPADPGGESRPNPARRSGADARRDGRATAGRALRADAGTPPTRGRWGGVRRAAGAADGAGRRGRVPSCHAPTARRGRGGAPRRRVRHHCLADERIHRRSSCLLYPA